MSSNHTHPDHQNILNGLQSASQEKILKSLEELKASGKASDIPVLVELLHLCQDQEVREKIKELFNNLKDKEVIPLIISAIQNQEYALERRLLVSSCWENGLDFSPYISLFVDLLNDNDYAVALEAYTVITNMTAKIDQAKLDIEIDRLEKLLPAISDSKRELILDVIDFLPSIGY